MVNTALLICGQVLHASIQLFATVDPCFSRGTDSSPSRLNTLSVSFNPATIYGHIIAQVELKIWIVGAKLSKALQWE